MLVKTLNFTPYQQSEVLNLQSPTQYISFHFKTVGIGTTVSEILAKLAESTIKVNFQSESSVASVIERMTFKELANIIAQTESNVRIIVTDNAAKKTELYLMVPVSAFGALSLDAKDFLTVEIQYRATSVSGTDITASMDIYCISSIATSGTFLQYTKLTKTGSGTTKYPVIQYTKMFIEKATLDTLKLVTASGATIDVNQVELQMMEASTGNLNYMLTTPSFTSLQDANEIVGLDISAIQEVEITTTDSAAVYFIR